MIPESNRFTEEVHSRKIIQNENTNSKKLGFVFLYLFIVGVIVLYLSIAYEEAFKIEKIFSKIFNHLI